MPFIQLEEDVPQEELRLKMDQPVVEDLKRYTEAFAHGKSVSAVVQEILRKVMARDKDFQKLKAPRQSGPDVSPVVVQVADTVGIDGAKSKESEPERGGRRAKRHNEMPADSAEKVA